MDYIQCLAYIGSTPRFKDSQIPLGAPSSSLHRQYWGLPADLFRQLQAQTPIPQMSTLSLQERKKNEGSPGLTDSWASNCAACWLYKALTHFLYHTFFFLLGAHTISSRSELAPVYLALIASAESGAEFLLMRWPWALILTGNVKILMLPISVFENTAGHLQAFEFKSCGRVCAAYYYIHLHLGTGMWSYKIRERGEPRWSQGWKLSPIKLVTS